MLSCGWTILPIFAPPPPPDVLDGHERVPERVNAPHMPPLAGPYNHVCSGVFAYVELVSVHGKPARPVGALRRHAGAGPQGDEGLPPELQALFAPEAAARI